MSKVAQVALATLLWACVSYAQSPAVDDALFAVLTHKGGFAAGKAHNHLIVAEQPDVSLEWGDTADAPSSFELRAEVASLLVDPDPTRSRLFPRLQQLGLLDQAFAELDDSARAKIRGAMLSKKQLDAERHPQILVRLLRVATRSSSVGDAAFTHEGTIELKIHGVTVERPFRGRLERSDDGWIIEAVAEATFRELGIKPYSAFLGAVKNLDLFHLYLKMTVDGDTD